MIEQTVPTMRNLKSLIALAAIMIGLFFGTPCRAEESPASDERKVAESYNKTALKLFGELKKDSGNLVISPLSIGIAMSMSLTGARGATEAEMARVLNQRLPRERMD
ncbi:MAG: hypothetical protein HYU64_20365, partial [Armatimonadetes bacterium]|nr:hypothetical protein [Armatimonadota bacterium]